MKTKKNIQEPTWYAKPVLGYRYWACNDQGELSSIGLGTYLWSSEINYSFCNAYDHQAPAPNCHCGFNTFHDIDDPLLHAQVGGMSSAASAYFVLGAVALKGDLQIHKNGCRGREAVILGLVDNGNANVQRAGELYNVPVLSKKELVSACEQVAAPLNQGPPPKIKKGSVMRGKAINALVDFAYRQEKILKILLAVALLCLTVYGIHAFVSVANRYGQSHAVSYVLVGAAVLGWLWFVRNEIKPWLQRKRDLSSSFWFKSLSYISVSFFFLALFFFIGSGFKQEQRHLLTGVHNQSGPYKQYNQTTCGQNKQKQFVCSIDGKDTVVVSQETIKR